MKTKFPTLPSIMLFIFISMTLNLNSQTTLWYVSLAGCMWSVYDLGFRRIRSRQQEDLSPADPYIPKYKAISIEDLVLGKLYFVMKIIPFEVKKDGFTDVKVKFEIVDLETKDRFNLTIPLPEVTINVHEGDCIFTILDKQSLQLDCQHQLQAA